MRNTLIHIGYHKTATSWLQRYLFGRRDRGFAPLAPTGGLSCKRAAKFMAPYFVYDEERKLLSPFRSRTEEVRDLLPRFYPSDDSVPVVSSERLSGNPHSGGFDAKVIGNRLAESFPDARVLIVIREQASMILSTYFQYLKIGGASSLRSYLLREYDGRLPGFAAASFEYHRLIDHYYRLFGRENVLVLPYETFREEASCFVSAIAKFAGAEVDTDLEYESMPNQGSNRLVQYHTRFLNSVTSRSSVNSYSSWAVPRAEKPARWLRSAVPVSAATERRFVARLRDEIRDTTRNRFGDSNLRTSELIGADLTALGYE